MRCLLRECGGVRVYDDSYNSNPLSFEAALEAWRSVQARGRRWIVAGDMKELGEASRRFHEELGRSVAEAGAQLLLAVGEFAEDVARGAADAGMPPGAVEEAASADEAARRARELVREGDLVLVKGSRAVGLESVVEALFDLAGRD
jgi:UDP-N-acetylmuramoyl-tripeptide--D-alanyl-D-alanine ligase